MAYVKPLTFIRNHMLQAIVVLVVLASLGCFVVWRVQQNTVPAQSNTAPQVVRQAVSSAKCQHDDLHICRFRAAWLATPTYQLGTAQELDEQSSTSVFEVTNSGARSRISAGSGEYATETLLIGDVSYTKNKGTWYRKTLDQKQKNDYLAPYKIQFAEQSKDGAAVGEGMDYKKIGLEPCGERTCFRYSTFSNVTDVGTMHIWFDATSYQLRRLHTESPNLKVNHQVKYGKVTIDEPTEFRQLGPYEYIVPGSDESIAVPPSGE